MYTNNNSYIIVDIDLVKIFPRLVLKFLKKLSKEMRCHAI